MVELRVEDFKDAADWLVPLSAIPAVPAECEAIAERNYRRGYYDALMYALGRLEDYLPPHVNDQFWVYLKDKLLPWKRSGYTPDPSQPYLPPTFYPSGRRAKARVPDEGKEDFVYILEMEGTGEIKIGHSVDVHARRKSLQTGCPRQLRILRIIASPDAPKLETMLKQRYAPYCIHDEWFHLPSHVLAALLNEGFPL